MDSLQRLNSPSASVANIPSGVTPKRNLISQPMTPLNRIWEETEKKDTKTSSVPRNPFDVKAESLYLPSCSPSVFATFQRNKVNDGTFRWSVEHLSVLYPADIDETSVADTWVDSDQEMKAQKAIDTFFSQNSIVPSPWSSSPKEGKSRRRTCMNAIFHNVESNNVTTQTILSIPPGVDLTKILGNFFTFNDNEHNSSQENSQEEADLLGNSSLRRKLFVNDEECVSPSRMANKNLYFNRRRSTPTVHMRSVTTTPASDVLSSSPISIPNCSDSCNILSSPPVSPIRAETPIRGIQIESFNDHPGIENYYQSSDKLDSHSVAMSFCIESQETNPFPLSYSSEKQDTGYATGSMNMTSSQNMTSEVHYGLVSRITPVAELMEECELSNSATSDMSYKNDCGKVNTISSSDCLEKDQLHPHNFKTYPWVPTCCSTPANCSHL